MELKIATFNSAPCRPLCAVLLLAVALLSSPLAHAESPPPGGLNPPAKPPHRVAVVRRPGCQVYEKIVEEFRGQVRAIVRVLPVETQYRQSVIRWLRRYRPQLVFIVGQSAYDLLRSSDVGPILHALVFHDVVAGQTSTAGSVPPERVLRTFRALDPRIRTVAVLHGHETDGVAERAHLAAAPLGMKLIRLRARSPAHAITLLRRLGDRAEGLWLVTDLQILTAQVVQYALGVQFRRHLPVVGAARRHVEQGALLSLDYDPHGLGRRAAALANRILGAGRGRGRRRAAIPAAVPRLTLNRSTAQAIGVKLDGLLGSGAEVLQ